MELLFRRLAMLLVAGLLASAAGAAPLINPMSVGWTQEGEEWRTWKTDHFRIHSLKRHADWVQHIAREAEAAHAELTQEMLWQPRTRTDLVLTDDNDFANGWATAIPYNQVRLFLSPPDRFSSLEAYDDWLRLLIRHEYTHVLHLDQAEGSPRALQGLFGRLAFLFPHQFQPIWMIEGIAMNQEGSAAAGTGRGHSSLMRQRMRAEVAAEGGPRSLSRVSGLNRDWPSDQPYLYGVFFVQFLQETQGPDAVAHWLLAYRRNLIPYWMNPTARQTYGETFSDLWNDYQQWLVDRFPAREDAQERGEKLSSYGLDDAPPVARGEHVYRIEHDGHSAARLVRYSTWGRDVLTEVEYPGLMDVDEQQRVVVAGLSSRRDNRRLSDLRLWTQADGWRQITERKRYREARWWKDDQLVARRMLDGRVTLDLLDADGRFRDQLWQGEPGDVVGQFAIAPDGDFLVAGVKQAGHRGWQLRHFDLKRRQWQTLTANNRIQGQPSFSPDGQWILFSADYEGYYDLYRLNHSTGIKERLTRVDTGAFTPVQTLSGAIHYQHYSRDGYDLYRLDQPLEEPAPEQEQAVSAPAQPPADEVTVFEQGRYSGWSSSAPTWWLPFFNATDETWQIGATTAGQDALGRHAWQILAGRDATSSNAFGFLTYQFDNRYRLELQRDIDFFSGESGETVLARSKDRATFSRLNLFNALQDDLALNLGFYYERNADLWRDQGQPSTAPFDLSLFGVALQFNNSETYRYSISPVDGRRLSLVAETHDWLRDDFSGSRVLGDWWEYKDLGRSHVLVSRLAGVATETGAAPLRLGGEPTSLPAVFGRDRYPLRGYKSDALLGQRFGLASLEWRFPLARPQTNWQVYPLGIRDIYGSLFTDAGRLWRAEDPETEHRTYFGAGGEVTTELVLGYRLLLPVTLGAARGLDSELGEDRVWLRTGVVF